MLQPYKKVKILISNLFSASGLFTADLDLGHVYSAQSFASFNKSHANTRQAKDEALSVQPTLPLLKFRLVKYFSAV